MVVSKTLRSVCMFERNAQSSLKVRLCLTAASIQVFCIVLA